MWFQVRLGEAEATVAELERGPRRNRRSHHRVAAISRGCCNTGVTAVTQHRNLKTMPATVGLAAVGLSYVGGTNPYPKVFMLTSGLCWSA
jgi:hypothetical protein